MGVRVTILALEKHKYCTFWVFVASFIQHAMRMRRIILSSVTCPVLQYIFPLSYSQHDFGKKIIE